MVKITHVCVPPADPESQRKRTVQNVLDLRQNLEETMTSLRGVQLSHRSAVSGLFLLSSHELKITDSSTDAGKRLIVQVK